MPTIRAIRAVAALIASATLVPILPAAIAVVAVYLFPGKIPAMVPDNAIVCGALMGALASGFILVRVKGPALLRIAVWVLIVALMFTYWQGSFLRVPDYITKYE